MPERVLLHDWFFTFQLLDDAWTVVAWGRGHASSSRSRAPLRPHTVAERISLEQFVESDGTLIELIGLCDVARARQAGVPEPVTTGFSKGIPPAWMLLLGLANSIYALATLPLALLPPGASRPPSPAPLPQRLLVDINPDDEALPESLFNLGTDYKRPEGAPSTVKQLAAVLDLRNETECDEDDLNPRKDRDAEYDEDAVEMEEEEDEAMEEAPLDRTNGGSQGGTNGFISFEGDYDRATFPPHLDHLPVADFDTTLNPSPSRIAVSPPLNSTPPDTCPEKPHSATEDPTLKSPFVNGAFTTSDVVQVVEEASGELGGSSKEDCQVNVEGVMSGVFVEHVSVEQKDDKEEGEMVLDMPPQSMSFLDTLEAFVTTSPGPSDNLELYREPSPVMSSVPAAPHSPASLGAPFAFASKPNADPSATLTPAHEPSSTDNDSIEAPMMDLDTVAESQGSTQAVKNSARSCSPFTRDDKPRVVPESPGAHRTSTPPPVAAFLGSDVSPQFEPAMTSFGAIYQDSEVESVDNFANEVVQFIADDAEGRGGQLRGRSATAETASEVAVEESLLRDRWDGRDRHEVDVVEGELKLSQAVQALEEVIAESPRSSPAPDLDIPPKLEAESHADEVQATPQPQSLEQPSEDRPLDDSPCLEQPSAPSTEQFLQQSPAQQPLQSYQAEQFTEEQLQQVHPTDEQPCHIQPVIETRLVPRSPSPQPEPADAGPPRSPAPLDTSATSERELTHTPRASITDFAALYRDDTAERGAFDEGIPAHILNSAPMEEDTTVQVCDQPLDVDGTLEDSSAQALISQGQASTTDDDGSARPAGLLSLLATVDPTDVEDTTVAIDSDPFRHALPVSADTPSLAPAAVIVESSSARFAREPQSPRTSTSCAVEVKVPTCRKAQSPSSPAAKLASPKTAIVASPDSPRKAAITVALPLQDSHVASTSLYHRAAMDKQPSMEPATLVAPRLPPHVTPPPLAAAPPRSRHTTASPRKLKMEPYVDIVIRRRRKSAQPPTPSILVGATGPDGEEETLVQPRSVAEINDEVQEQETITNPSPKRPPIDDRSPSLVPTLHLNSSPVKPFKKRSRPMKRSIRVVDSEDEASKQPSPVLEASRDRSTSLEQSRSKKRLRAVKKKDKGKAKAVISDDEEEEDDIEAPTRQQESTPEAEDVDEEEEEDDFILGPSSSSLKRTPSAPTARSLAISRAPSSTSRRASLPSSTSRSGARARPNRIASDLQTNGNGDGNGNGNGNGRPQRARKSTEGWWKLDRALESLQSGKKRVAKEEIEEEEQEEDEEGMRGMSKGRASGSGRRKKARMVIADSEEEEEEEEEREETEVPVKRKMKFSRRPRQSKSKAPSPRLSPKLKLPPPPRPPHRTQPTDLGSTSKNSKMSNHSLPRWSHGASWEGLGEIRLTREVKEDSWNFSD